MSTAVYVIALILDRAISIYIVVIIIRAIVSWFRPNYFNPIVRFLFGITDPVLNPVRDLIYYKMGIRLGGIDISPLVVILALSAVKELLLPAVVRWVSAIA